MGRSLKCHHLLQRLPVSRRFESGGRGSFSLKVAPAPATGRRGGDDLHAFDCEVARASTVHAEALGHVTSALGSSEAAAGGSGGRQTGPWGQRGYQ